MNPSFSSPRVASIDVFRALTMFLMIVVNDFWGISGIPHWLEHAKYGEDMLGFSDIIFPSFLFILGMSIPFAIENRIKKGESCIAIVKHIVLRSIALLVMGLFTVNFESLGEIGINTYLFPPGMLFGFFLIWNIYPKRQDWRKYIYKGLQILGIVILIYLAVIFRDKEGNIMQHKWWGILGLIGWTYLICALIYLFIRQKLKYLTVAWLFFAVWCIAEANQWLGSLGGIIPGKGVFHAFTMGGLLTSLLYNRFPFKKMLLWMPVAGIVLLISGWISNHFWIISKLGNTPPWMFYCTGISILSYLFIYWLVEQNGKYSWFRCIEPAGAATLTCYLIPYWLYILFYLIRFPFPSAWLVYPLGLLKCILFSFLAIWITFGLGKIGIKLKI